MKAFLVFGFGMSLMSITWIVLCFLAVKKSNRESEKRERITNLCHQTLFYKLISDDILSFQSLAKESTMTRTISNA